MVDGDGADVDEFGQVILVGNIVPMPRNHVKGRVLLRALEVLTTKLVDYFPLSLLYFVLCNRM